MKDQKIETENDVISLIEEMANEDLIFILDILKQKIPQFIENETLFSKAEKILVIKNLLKNKHRIISKLFEHLDLKLDKVYENYLKEFQEKEDARFDLSKIDNQEEKK